MFYEDESDLMVKLRPYVSGDRINIPMSNVMNRKWSKVVNPETCEARAANPLLDAFLSGRNAFVLLIVADVMHNLKLSVSFEMFKRETGFDPFDSKNNSWATAEINRLRGEAGDEDVTALIEPLMWSIMDIQCNMPTDSNRNYNDEIWELLGISPQETIANGTATTSLDAQQLEYDECVRMSRRSSTPKKKIPLYKRVSSVDLLGGSDRY